MNEHRAFWTAKGLSLLRASMTGGAAVDIVQIAIGDGQIDPATATGLVREVYRGAAMVLPVPNRPDQLLVQMTVPYNIGGWTAAELMAIDRAGNGVAVASIEPTPKVALTSGAPNEFVLRMYLAITSTSNVVITIDPSAIGASQQHVASSITAHSQAPDPHAVYVLKAAAAEQYAPKVHGHAIADVAGLTAALDSKTDASTYQAAAMPLDQILFFGSFA